MTSLAAAQKVTARARSKKVSTAKKANRMPMLKFETPLSSAVAYVARDDHFLKIGYRRRCGWKSAAWAAAEYQYPLACFANHPAGCPFLYLKGIAGAACYHGHIGRALHELLNGTVPYCGLGGAPITRLLVYRYIWGPAATTSSKYTGAATLTNEQLEECSSEKHLLPTGNSAHFLHSARTRHFAALESWYAADAIHTDLLAKGLVADFDA